MSNTYRLVDHGYPFKKIMNGKAWIGRVVAHAEGGYLGRIDTTTARASTEQSAFEEVVAKHLGYQSAAALKEKNRQVRGVRRAQSQRARELADRFIAGDLKTKIDVIDEMLGFKGGKR